MTTIENFVDPLIIMNPKILFITENCPNLGMYLYRTLESNPNIVSPHANNLLNNLCSATGIIATSEKDKLDAFINKKYALIDTFVNGQKWDNNTPSHNLEDICDDIKYLDPEQIVFTCIRSNGRLFKEIYSMLPSELKSRIISRSDEKNVFNSPSDRAFRGFKLQLGQVIEAGRLIL
jgi:hypothetical protein